MRFALRISSRGVLWGGIAAVATLIVVNGMVSYDAMRHLVSNVQWVEHTRAVEFELDRLQRVLGNADSSERDYLQNGTEESLHSYITALRDYVRGLGHIGLLVADNPEQSKRVSELEIAGRAKLQEALTLPQLHRSGRAMEARLLVASSLEKSEMRKFRDAVIDMEGAEIRLLQARTARVQTSEMVGYSTVGLSALAALLALLGFGIVLARAERTREESAAAIRDREEWLSTTLASIGDAVIVCDERGRVRFLNVLAQNLAQHTEPEVFNLPLREVFPIFNENTGAPAEGPAFRVFRENSEIPEGQVELRRSDGTSIPVAYRAGPIRGRDGRLIGAVVVFRDLSEERKVERALRVSEKLAATGRLAATVAHEVNNPLEAVTNILYLLRGDPGMTAKGQELLAAAEEQLARIAHITRQTLSFYRNTAQHEMLSLAESCDRVLDVYRERIASKHVCIEKDYAEDLPVLATSGELTQVLSNLISNALDAVSAGGTISVSVFAGADERVFLTVQDDGCGIEADILDHIFEPFFTTKKDVGTGLGLWVTREIVEKLGGSVTASSDGPGQGSQFALSLPLRQEEQQAARGAIA